MGRVVEGQAVPLGQSALLLVVGDDGDDVDRQGVRAPAVQQAVEAVTVLGDGDDHPNFVRLIAQRPLDAQWLHRRTELSTECALIDGLAARLEDDAHDRTIRDRVEEVMRLEYVGAATGQVRGHGCHHAHAIGAGQSQDITSLTQDILTPQ